MDETESPNQFRQNSETVKSTETTVANKERVLTPTIIILGILLAVGGIFMGLRNRDNKVVSLPDYTPVTITSQATSSSPVVSPSTIASPKTTPSPQVSPSFEAPVVVTIAGSPEPVRAPVKTLKKKPITTKKVLAAVPVTVAATPPSNSPLPDYSPTVTSSGLPEYQPVVPLANYQPQLITPSPEAPSPALTVTLQLQVPGHSYSVTVKVGATVHEVLQAAQSQGFNFKTQQFSFGPLVTEINGVSQSTLDNKYWVYYLNNVSATKGISAQTVGNGDIVSWQFVTPL